YEPAVDSVIVPLRMGYASDEARPLELDAASLLPPERFLAGATVLQPAAIAAAGHRHGPSSPEFDAACVAALDALLEIPRATQLLVTADHGQVDIEAFDALD